MFDFWLPSTEETTPSQLAVLVVSFSILTIVVGIIALVFALRAPPDKHAAAALLALYGLASITIGILTAFCYWLFRRLWG